VANDKQPVDTGNVLNTIYYWAAHAARANNLADAKLYSEQAMNHANNAILARLDPSPKPVAARPTRVEVIDHRSNAPDFGRVNPIELSYQDDGRTLKIFLKDAL
jgi:hypothetical protein